MNYTTPDQPKKLRRFMPYIWVLGLLTLIASVGGTGWMLSTQAADKAAASGTPVASPSGDSLVVGIGYVDVKHGLIHLFPSQPNRVVEVMAEESAKVAKGTPLVRLDDRAAKLTLARAEEDVKAAEAGLSQAKKAPQNHDLEVDMQNQAIAAKQLSLNDAKDKLKTIVDRNNEKRSTSNKTYDKAVQDEAENGVRMYEFALKAEQDKLKRLQLDDPQVKLTEAQANLDAKKLQRDLAQLALNECVLKAPVDGTVVRIQTTVGDVFGSPTKQAAMLFCPDEPRVIRVEIDQEFANRIKVGQPARIQDDTTAAGSWQGKVSRMSDIYADRRNFVQGPFQFNDVRTLECIIELEPNQEPLRINQRVRVTLSNQ